LLKRAHSTLARACLIGSVGRNMKDVAKITPADFQAHAVWKFTGRNDPSETAVEPVKKLPAKSLGGALAGVEVTLAYGKKVAAFLGNIDVEQPRSTEHFITLSVFGEHGEIFHLARYHDVDFAERGPEALAAFLKMKKEEVFPISWDARHLVLGAPSAAHGQILAEPRKRLSKAHLIALAVP
jgi:hypothetical protein